MPNTFFWTDLQIQTWTTWGAAPEQKGYDENTDLRSSRVSWMEGWGWLLLTDGQRSQFNTLHRKVGWLGCFSKQDLQASPETLPGVVLKTSYRHLLHSLHQTGVQRSLQKVFWKPSSPAATVIVEHETRVKPVSGVKNPWSATGWSRTGLQHHQPIVHLS